MSENSKVEEENDDEVIIGTRYVSDGGSVAKKAREKKARKKKVDKKSLKKLFMNEIYLLRKLACVEAKFDTIFNLFSKVIALNKPFEEIRGNLLEELDTKSAFGVENKDDIQKDNDIFSNTFSNVSSDNDDDGNESVGESDVDDNMSVVSLETPKPHIVETTEKTMLRRVKMPTKRFILTNYSRFHS